MSCIVRDVSPSNIFFGSLKSEIFIKRELALMTKMTLYLETKRNYIDRSETIQDLKMNAFGIQWMILDGEFFNFMNGI